MGLKLFVIEVKSVVFGVVYLREVVEDIMFLRENVILFNFEIVWKLEFMIMKFVCGGSNDENVNGVMLKIWEILEFVFFYVGGLV